MRPRPGWDVWTRRLPRVVSRRPRSATGSTGAWPWPKAARTAADVAIFGHGHNLRVLGARWIGLPAAAGGRLRLDTAGVCVLGYEHGERVLLRWNQPVPEGA